MTSTEALKNHLTLCDELYQLALEENRFLKQQQRVTEAALLERKRTLLGRLDASLSSLKSTQAGAAPGRNDAERKDVIEKAKAKILQILHLDRENEQLLLRYSLNVRPRIAPAPTSDSVAPVVPTSAPSHLQRLYERHAGG